MLILQTCLCALTIGPIHIVTILLCPSSGCHPIHRQQITLLTLPHCCRLRSNMLTAAHCGGRLGHVHVCHTATQLTHTLSKAASCSPHIAAAAAAAKARAFLKRCQIAVPSLLCPALKQPIAALVTAKGREALQRTVDVTQVGSTRTHCSTCHDAIARVNAMTQQPWSMQPPPVQRVHTVDCGC